MGYHASMTSRSKLLRVGVSLAFAAVLLFFFLRSLDFPAVGRAIRGAHPGWIAISILAGLFTTPVLRSIRWGLFLKGFPTRAWDLNSATSIGFAASTLLPARAGEIVRPVALSRAAGIPLAPCIASVGLERLFDLIVTVSLFVTYALFWEPKGMTGDEASRFALLRRLAYLLGAGTAFGVALLGVLAARRDLTDRVLAPFLRALPPKIAAKIASILHSFLDGMSALKTAKDVLVLAVFSLVIWLIICFQIHATLRAFDLDFPYPVTFFVLTWAVMGLAIPTPGGVGGYHVAIAYALTGFYGVPKDTAAAFALISHAISFAPITILGLAFLLAGGLSLTKLAEAPAHEDSRSV